jgi:hypothetical protein
MTSVSLHFCSAQSPYHSRRACGQIANGIANIEARLLGTTVGSVVLICVPGAVWAVGQWRKRTRAAVGMQLMFEEQLPPEVFSLKLDRG